MSLMCHNLTSVSYHVMCIVKTLQQCTCILPAILYIFKTFKMIIYSRELQKIAHRVSCTLHPASPKMTSYIIKYNIKARNLTLVQYY